MAVDYCHRLGIANRDIKVRRNAGVPPYRTQHLRSTSRRQGPAAICSCACGLTSGQRSLPAGLAEALPATGHAVRCSGPLAAARCCSALLSRPTACGSDARSKSSCAHELVRLPAQLDNLLLHNGSQLKMADFGFSKDTLGQSTCKSSCGTPEVRYTR